MFSAMDSGTTAVVYIDMYIHQDTSVLHVDVVSQTLFTAVCYRNIRLEIFLR